MADVMMKNMQTQLEKEADVYRDIQKDIQKNHQSRQTFLQQQSENEMVLKEIEMLDEDANVFKLVGPVLVKQDMMEAKANVSKRIEFITKETTRLDVGLKVLEAKQGQKQKEIGTLQQKMQGLAKGAQAAQAS